MPFISELFRMTWPLHVYYSMCMSRFGLWKSGWAKTQPGLSLAIALYTGTRVFLQLFLQLYFIKFSCQSGLFCIYGLPICPTAQNISILHSLDKEVTYQKCHDRGPRCFQEGLECNGRHHQLNHWQLSSQLMPCVVHQYTHHLLR